MHNTILPNEDFWHVNDVHAVESAQDFAALYQVGERVLERMYTHYKSSFAIGVVCGPISSGGLMDRSRNLARFAQAIEAVQDQGYPIFSQMPFEEAIGRLLVTEGTDGLLETFYQPLFSSGMIKKQFFQHDWETSKGSKWERELGQELGLKAWRLLPPPNFRVIEELE